MTAEVVYALMAELIIETVVTEVYKLKELEKSNKMLSASLLID
jgi:tRNA A37 threonylcarbamoyladenosine synthetase subunit TsaC/SUA5/YrdC